MPQELIEPHKGDKRYVRRGKKGKFTTRHADVGRSLSRDRRSKAKRIVKKGEGDQSAVTTNSMLHYEPAVFPPSTAMEQHVVQQDLRREAIRAMAKDEAPVEVKNEPRG
jgi:hypothetical protein